MSFLTRRIAIDRETGHTEGHGLKPTLGWPHLVALGVGAIVGTGIYTLTGTGAGMAGPGVMLSFAIAGAVCAAAALCYAEMATLMPRAGSAYTYSYAVMGETVAWIIGWSLILEYTLVCAAVSVGWANHAAEFVRAWAPGFPEALLNGPHVPGGIVNLPAVFIALAVGALLSLGTRESATVNFILVIIKLAALALFVVMALPSFDLGNFTPFSPNGWASLGPDGAKLGILPAASLMFFAFYGFDAISTAAEEAKNPRRDLTIGIVGSMVLCTLIYMVVAAAAIGASPTEEFSKSAAPLVFVLEKVGHADLAKIVAGAAVVALPTVIMVFMYGQSRVFYAMARDGLLPGVLARVNAKTGTPVLVTLFTAAIAAGLGGFMTLKEIAELANAGTLAAFIAVALSMMILRLREPGRERMFRTPLWWLVGPLAVVGCIYLFWNLPVKTQTWFLYWNLGGLALYLVWARTRSNLAKA